MKKIKRYPGVADEDVNILVSVQSKNPETGKNVISALLLVPRKKEFSSWISYIYVLLVLYDGFFGIFYSVIQCY